MSTMNRNEIEVSVVRRYAMGVLLAFGSFFLASLMHAPFTFDFVEFVSAQEGSASSVDNQTTLAEWHVFLVASNAYDVGVRKLRYCENDVRDLKNIFEALGVKDENIVVLSTENEEYSLKPYKESIDDRYEEFIYELTENSIAFVFLSGHGFCIEEKGKKYSFYAPADWQSGKLDEKKVSIDDMMKKLNGSKARFKWMCVDACRNVILKRGVGERSLSIDKAPKGIVLMQSCDLGQYSHEAGSNEKAPFENGLFTRAFIDAISDRAQDADVDGDGRVNLGELCDYVAKRVPSDARKYCGNAKQNPIVTPFNNSSLDEFAKYSLFEDSRWHEVQIIRDEVEELVKQGMYAEALEKIKVAQIRLAGVSEIKRMEERIQQLLNENNVKLNAEVSFKRAQEAFNAQKYQESLGFIEEALNLDQRNQTYEEYKRLIQSAIKQNEESELSSSVSDEKQSAIDSTPQKRVLIPTAEKAGEVATVNIAGVNVRFRWCPAGKFVMGSPEGEIGRENDERPFEVTLTRGFWLAETETSQELWLAVMNNNPSSFKGGNLPVERVTWDDCQAFIKRIQDYAPVDMRFKLPSEAHWEYACRADGKTAYWWGDDPEDGTGKLNGADAKAKKKYPDWTTFQFDDGFVETSPIGCFEANAWGLRDMAGNVWEWCSDWYKDAYPAESVTDPSGPKDGSNRVVRGGGWKGNPKSCRSASRSSAVPNVRRSMLGFRLELTDVVEESSSVEISASGDNRSEKSLPQIKSRRRNPKPGEVMTVKIAGVDTQFHWCPPGTFIMGSPEEGEDKFNVRIVSGGTVVFKNSMGHDKDAELARSTLGTGVLLFISDEAQHKVKIKRGFWLAETETSQELWMAVMERNPSLYKGNKLPVENVRWEDCQEFIGRIQGDAPDGMIFSLPSEAHWEYACRAGTTTPFSFGYTLNGDMANCNGEYPYPYTIPKGLNLKKTIEIGSYAANRWGLYDMHGNVAEWCEDWYGLYPSEPTTDPTGPVNGSYHVDRGGSYNDTPVQCRSACRGRPFIRNSMSQYMGFRLELSEISK